MDFNKRIEALIGIGLDDYPGSEYSPIEEFYESYSRFPRFISKKTPSAPIFGLFEAVEVVTYPNLYNRMMTFVCSNFKPEKMPLVEELVSSLVDIYGRDNKGMLWLLEEEIEEILMGKWEGRIWEFEKYEEVHDVFLLLTKENTLELTIKETGNLIDFD
jgi:hypothetical protein